MKRGIKAVLILAAVLGCAGIGLTVGGVAAGTAQGVTRAALDIQKWMPARWYSFRGDQIESREQTLIGEEEHVTDVVITADVADVTVHLLNEKNRKECGVEASAKAGSILVETTPLLKEDYEGRYVSVYAEDGVLYIDAHYDYENQEKSPKIDVYLPEDQSLSLQIDLGAGDVDLEDGVSLEELNAKVQTGDLDAEMLKCLGNADIQADLGDVSLNFTELSGDLYAYMGVGDIEVDLPGEMADYNFDLSVGIGSLECGNIIYDAEDEDEDEWHDDEDEHHAGHGVTSHIAQSGLGSELQLTNNPGGSTITIQTDVGDLEVSFER